MKNEDQTSIHPLRQKSGLSNSIGKQPTNRPPCGCSKNKISKEFKDLPVISVRPLQNIKADMNATSEGVTPKSSDSNIPSAEEVVLPETQKTQIVVDDFSASEQENLKMKLTNIYNKITRKIKSIFQNNSI